MSLPCEKNNTFPIFWQKPLEKDNSKSFYNKTTCKTTKYAVATTSPVQWLNRKKTKIVQKGARGDMGSLNQNESPVSDFSKALKLISLVCGVVGEILTIQKTRNISKICKNVHAGLNAAKMSILPPVYRELVFFTL